MMAKSIFFFMFAMAVVGVVYYGFKALPGTIKWSILKWLARLAVIAVVVGSCVFIFVNIF